MFIHFSSCSRRDAKGGTGMPILFKGDLLHLSLFYRRTMYTLLIPSVRRGVRRASFSFRFLAHVGQSFFDLFGHFSAVRSLALPCVALSFPSHAVLSFLVLTHIWRPHYEILDLKTGFCIWSRFFEHVLDFQTKLEKLMQSRPHVARQR